MPRTSSSCPRTRSKPQRSPSSEGLTQVRSATTLSLVKSGDFRRPAVAALVPVVALLMVTAAGAGSQRGPTVDLSVAQANFGSSDAVLVKLTYSNPTKHTVHV